MPGLAPLIAIGIAVEPLWRVHQRVDDGVRTERLVEGNGVRLIWAPEGPGWVMDARQACHGQVYANKKTLGMGTLGFRAVREP